MGKKILTGLFSCFLVLPLAAAPPCESGEASTRPCDIKNYQYQWGNSPLPSSWKYIPKPLNPPERKSRERLWVRFRLPEKIYPNHSLYIPVTHLIFQVYINDKQIYALGKIDAQGRGRYVGRPFHILPLKPEYAGRTVYVRIFSDWMSIGIGGFVQVGSESDFIRNIIKKDLDRFFMGLLMIFLAVLALLLFVGNRGNKILLYLGILASSSGLFAISGHTTHIKQILYDAPELWNIIAYTALYSLPLGLFLYIREIFGKTFNKTLLGFALIHMTVSPILLLLKLRIDFPLYHGNIYILVLFLMESLVIFYIIARAVKAGNQEARIIFFGLICIVGFSFFDALKVIMGYHERNIAHWGTFLFILSLYGVVARRYRTTYENLSLFSRTLERKNKALYNLKNNLESLVVKRTANLNLALEEVQNKDRIFQYEMELAADIQRGILPKTPLNIRGLAFESHYQSMHKVGGDIFDIFPLDDKHLGVIMGDVSGHGVPAALITAMVKISLKNSSPGLLTPHGIFEELNDVMVKHVQTHDYLTAALLVFGPGGRVLYSGAGHGPTLVSRKSGSVEEWNTEGFLLGVRSRLPLMYTSNEQFIHSQDRLLLYTDGVTEAHNGAGEQYSLNRLRNIFELSRKLSLADARLSILEDWNGFRETAPISDDMTFLLIEVQ